MSIYEFFKKDGKPRHHSFSEGRKKGAEVKFPDCTIILNDGFSERKSSTGTVSLKMQQSLLF